MRNFFISAAGKPKVARVGTWGRVGKKEKDITAAIVIMPSLILIGFTFKIFYVQCYKVQKYGFFAE